MSDGIIHLLRAGVVDNVVEQFKMIVESARFEGIPIAKRLSLIITGGRSGNNQGNRDTPIYELCHLVGFLDALGYKSTGGRFEFFLGIWGGAPPPPASEGREGKDDCGGKDCGGDRVWEKSRV